MKVGQNCALPSILARDRIAASEADLLIIYSTTWPSIIGHQIQADPNPVWNLVDHDFHDLGTMEYDFKIDSDFAAVWNECNKRRGLQSRTINYHGFPIDVGSVVANKLLNPDNRTSGNGFLKCVCKQSRNYSSCKGMQGCSKENWQKSSGSMCNVLSNRMFTDFVQPEDDRIHSLKDDEWNKKVLEFLGDGRLEDVAQLSRTIQNQIRVKKVVAFKPMWWLSAMNDNRNNLTGEVLAYEALHGAGGAVVHLDPTSNGSGDKEYDEDDVEIFGGERNVLDKTLKMKTPL